MRRAEARALVSEARSLGFALREEIAPSVTGPIVVTGVLAEQLAKELGAGAEAGAVVFGSDPPSRYAAVLVHVVAGDPSSEDEELVHEAEARGVEVVIVELWPQPDWTRPFVLSPFVVECRAGEGFPVGEIAARIVEATEGSTLLAANVPAIAEAARADVVRQAVVRSALIGLVGARIGATRPLLTLEQVRMVSRLRAVSSGHAIADERRALAGAAAVAVAAGFGLRSAARTASAFLPRPVVNAAVAAAGSWALAKAFQAVESRVST